MYKYDGLLIHQSHDDQGIIEVIDDRYGVRGLYFGSDARQSSMLLQDPNQLHALYARAMMGLLLFNESPRDILMIGLGGGMITKFLLHQFTECKINVIEYRRSVLKVAHSHFNLPLDPRLKVKIGCGGDYVWQQSQQSEEKHDLIVVDAYHHEGMAIEVSNESFFDSCRTLLTEDGVLAINLWQTNQLSFQQVTWNINAGFQWQVLFLPVRKRGNMIGFAFKKSTHKLTIKQLREKADQLEQCYHLDFPSFVNDLKRNNSNTLKKGSFCHANNKPIKLCQPKKLTST